MTSLAPAPRRLVLADLALPTGTAARAVLNVVLVLAGTALVAGLAQLIIPTQPIPFTGQTLGVLLVGAALGPLRGAASLGLYLVLGLVGVPVYAPQPDGSHLTGATAFAAPSFGYLVGFVVAATIVGFLSRLAWDRNVLKMVLSFAIGSIVIYTFGVGGLMISLGLDFPTAVLIGVVPFLIGDAIKALIAAGLLPGSWKLISLAEKKTRA
jgi:biotin transport system substrate-specific component